MSRLAALFIALFAGVLAACAPTSRSPEPSPALGMVPAADVTAIIGVTVVPMDTAATVPDQTVVVRRGRIVAMGPTARTPVPIDARRIDGTGRFLLPGLVDMHTHLDSAATLPLLVANGVTTVRNMWGTARTLEWRREITRGTRLGPTIYTAGAVVDGEPPVWSGSAVVETPAEAERTVEGQKNDGYDFVKVYNNLTVSAYDGLVAAARRANMPLVGHVPTRVGLAHALAAHQASIEHLTGYLVAAQENDSPFFGTTLLPHRRHLASHVDVKKIPELARATRAAGVVNCPTLTVDQWFVPSLERARREALPEMRFAPPWMRAAWAPADGEVDAPPEEYRENKHAEQILGEITRALQHVGAPLLLGTDSPNPYVLPGFSVHHELENLVAAGLTPYEALRSATRAPAEFLHAEREFGTVAVGLRADLLLVDGNPLVDVRFAARRVGVLVGGRWLGGSDLDALLERLAASYVPPADRFAALSPLGSEGARQWSARFRIGIRGAPLGEERAAIDRTPGGDEIVFAQAVTDEPDPSRCSVRLAMGAHRNGVRLSLDDDGPEGHAGVTVTRAGGRIHISGRRSEGQGIDLDLPLGDDVLLAGPTLADDLPLCERIVDMRPGETRSVRALAVSIAPEFQLIDVNYRVERLPARDRRSYLIDTHEQRSHERVQLELDENGRPRRLLTQERRGPVEFSAE